jgi:hypothetical protein
VQYLTLAGKQALNRSAFAEAQAQLQKGLEWIKALRESLERDARELDLMSALAQVLFVKRGFSAPETRAAAERVRDLAEKSGNLAQLVVQVFGIWRVFGVSGDYLTGALLVDRILYLAQREGSPTSLAFAHHAQLTTRLHRGDLVGVEEHFRHWSRFREAAGYRQVPGTSVFPIGLASLGALILGHVDSARERMAQLIAFARDSKNPFDLAFARYFESWLYRFLREPQRAEAAATQALALSE